MSNILNINDLNGGGYTNLLLRRRELMMQSGGIDDWPIELQKIEYLQSTREQYIIVPNVDLRRAPNAPYRLNIDFTFVDAYTPGYDRITQSGPTCIQGIDGRSNQFNVNNEYGNTFVANQKVKFSHFTWYTDGATRSVYSTDGIDTYTRNYFMFNNYTDVWLFNNSTLQKYSKAKIWKFEMICDGEKRMDLIPCYVKDGCTFIDVEQDNKLAVAGTKGVYDMVNKKFHTNRNTGNDFIAGPDLN